MGKSAPTDWDSIRSEFPTTKSHIYLDAANKGILPKTAAASIEGWVQDIWQNAGQQAFANEIPNRTRTELAVLLGAKPTEIAFIKNTSEGLNIVAHGLRLREGDNVIISDREHPANGVPWRHLERDGIEVRLVSHAGAQVLVDEYLAKIDARTRAISASWIFYGNGARLNIQSLAEICRKKGIFFVVDAIQGVGVFDLAVGALGADAVTAGGHKGLLGLTGTGFLWVSPESLHRLQPRFAARFSYREDNWRLPNLSLSDGTPRFEYGNPNQLGLTVLANSAVFLRGIGLINIESRIRSMTDRLIEGLDRTGMRLRTPRPWSKHGSIVTLDLPCPSDHLSRHLISAKIVATVRPDEVRASLGLYTNEDDIDQFVDILSTSRETYTRI